jgi:methylated-DNA-[protein]-cysteine S-methyltransferase
MTSAIPAERLSRRPPRPRRSHAVADSPVGPLTLVAADGAVTGLYMDEQRHRPPQEVFGDPAEDPAGEPFAAAFGQLREYFDGRRTEFDIRLSLDGTAFQQRVWAALRAIPYGQTVSYGQLADRLGQPSASRAVGLANGKNPVSIIVPCHRVVGADGSLTGYGGGIERKRYLLAHELRVSGQTLA